MEKELELQFGVIMVKLESIERRLLALEEIKAFDPVKLPKTEKVFLSDIFEERRPQA